VSIKNMYIISGLFYANSTSLCTIGHRFVFILNRENHKQLEIFIVEGSLKNQ
jgi:hypothetical protein